MHIDVSSLVSGSLFVDRTVWKSRRFLKALDYDVYLLVSAEYTLKRTGRSNYLCKKLNDAFLKNLAVNMLYMNCQVCVQFLPACMCWVVSKALTITLSPKGKATQLTCSALCCSSLETPPDDPVCLSPPLC